MSYIQDRAVVVQDEDALEAAEELVEKHEPGTLTIDGVDADEPDVEPADPVDAMLAPYERQADERGDEELSAVREVGVSRDGVPSPDGVVDRFDSMSDMSAKAEFVETLNGELRKRGVRRRYVLGEGSVPGGVVVFSDGIGKYYYETESYRPSDLFGSLESYIKSDDRVVDTVAALVNVYPMAMDDVAGSSVAEKFVDDVLVDVGDTVERDDAFDREVVEAVGKALMETDHDTT